MRNGLLLERHLCEMLFLLALDAQALPVRREDYQRVEANHLQIQLLVLLFLFFFLLLLEINPRALLRRLRLPALVGLAGLVLLERGVRERRGDLLLNPLRALELRLLPLERAELLGRQRDRLACRYELVHVGARLPRIALATLRYPLHGFLVAEAVAKRAGVSGAALQPEGCGPWQLEPQVLSQRLELRHAAAAALQRDLRPRLAVRLVAVLARVELLNGVLAR